MRRSAAPRQEDALVGADEMPNDIADGPFPSLGQRPDLLERGVAAERPEQSQRGGEAGDDERLIHGEMLPQTNGS